MKLRRCAVLFIEPREELAIDWAALLSGSSALAASLRWVALAPHLERETEIDAAQLAALGGIGQTAWCERELCDRQYGAAVIGSLLALGLLIAEGGEASAARERDEVLRAQHWKPLSATAHIFSRWTEMRIDSGIHFPNFAELVEAYGIPPQPSVSRCADGEALALPPAPDGALDEVLLHRYTGRNFDAQAVLPLALAARLLQRSFGAQARRMMAPDAWVLKKTSPSAGGLHPIEAYVLAQRVEGVAPGLYHYHPERHVLEPMGGLDGPRAADLALRAVADQDWFVAAPMMVVLSARVARNFWKYRNHAKAHRALMLDAGHLSQTFYLLATEAGMPAFVTAAINEVVLEKAFGLDPLCDAVIAVCGCGPASGAQEMVELRYEE